MNILIIEDDLIIAENIKEYIEEFGNHQIYIAKDYRACKEIKEKVKPDLFLVDIKLEGSEKDGIDIMSNLFPKNQSPIIYISTLVDLETRDKAKKTNPAAYLVKPFSQKQLEVAIDFAITHANKNQQIEKNIVIDHCPFISEPDYFYVKVKDKYEKISKANIVALQSQGTYTDIITTTATITHYLNMKVLLERINSKNILRCHNSYAVNVHYISSFDSDSLYVVGGKDIRSLPIGNTFKGEIMDKMPRL